MAEKTIVVTGVIPVVVAMLVTIPTTPAKRKFQSPPHLSQKWVWFRVDRI